MTTRERDVHFRLRDDERVALESNAKRRGYSMSFMLRLLIRLDNDDPSWVDKKMSDVYTFMGIGCGPRCGKEVDSQT